MSRRRTTVIGLVAAVAAAFAALQLWLPAYAARHVARSIAAFVPGHDGITVELAALPAARLLGGWIDAVAVDVMGPHVDGLKLEWVALRGRGVRVDVPALREGRLRVRQAAELRIEAAVAEKALAAYLADSVPAVTGVRVRLRAGRVELAADVPVLGVAAPVTVTGRVEAAGGARLRFTPEAFTLAGEAVTGPLAELLRAAWVWEVDLGFLPFPLAVDDVEVAEGRLIARGRWRDE